MRFQSTLGRNRRYYAAYGIILFAQPATHTTELRTSWRRLVRVAILVTETSCWVITRKLSTTTETVLTVTAFRLGWKPWLGHLRAPVTNGNSSIWMGELLVGWRSEIWNHSVTVNMWASHYTYDARATETRSRPCYGIVNDAAGPLTRWRWWLGKIGESCYCF